MQQIVIELRWLAPGLKNLNCQEPERRDYEGNKIRLLSLREKTTLQTDYYFFTESLALL